MRKILLLSFTISLSLSLFAQIGGLSGSKLGSFTTDVVDHHKVEFEPSFFHARSNETWDNNGNLSSLYSTNDSSKFVTGLNFRFTYGLWDKLEIGMSVSTDVSAAALGLRYVITQKEKYGLAAIAGLNVPLGNRTIDQTIRATGNLMQAGIGMVGSYTFTNNLSMDLTAQYVHFLKESIDNDRGGIYLNTDLGYYIFDHKLQLITGIGYHNISTSVGTHEILTVWPGVTIETGNNYIIILSVPFDVYGRRENKNVAVNFALTLTFN